MTEYIHIRKKTRWQYSPVRGTHRGQWATKYFLYIIPNENAKAKKLGFKTMAFVVEHTVATKYFIYIIPNENAVGNLGFFFFF